MCSNLSDKESLISLAYGEPSEWAKKWAESQPVHNIKQVVKKGKEKPSVVLYSNEEIREELVDWVIEYKKLDGE